MRDRAGRLIVVEVRGRADDRREPSRYLSPAKIRTLRRMASVLAARHERPVAIELVEVIGRLPENALARAIVGAIAGVWAFGFRARGFAVD